MQIQKRTRIEDIDLSKYEKNVSQSMVLLLDEKRVSLLSDDELLKYIDAFYNAGIKILGVKNEESVNSNFNKKSILLLVREKYNFLTISEVGTIIKNGAMGEYDEEVYSITMNRVNKWFKLFIEDSNRKFAITQIQRLQKKITNVEKTQEEKDKLFIDAILSEFERRKKYYIENDETIESIMGISFLFFDFFKSKGAIVDYNRENAIEEAKIIIGRYNSRNGMDVEKIIQNLSEKSDEVVNVAKSVSVKDFFNDLIVKGKKITIEI